MKFFSFIPTLNYINKLVCVTSCEGQLNCNLIHEITVKMTLNESTYRRSDIVSPSLSVSIESVSENVEFNTSSSSLNNESTNISIIYMQVPAGKNI